MINEEDGQLFEHLTMIVDAFEKQALRSGRKNGFMVAANNPLTGIEQLLRGSEKILKSAKQRKRDKDNGSDDLFGDSEDDFLNVDTTEFGIGFDESLDEFLNPDEKTGLDLAIEGGVEMDADLLSLMPKGKGRKKFARELAKCIGCDLRLTFDWQLKPINLLGPIASLLASLEDIIDQFMERLKGNPILDICNLLNNFNILCPLDILSILMALKMLLKRYILMSLDIKLDWTVVLGPLLKLILDGIVELLQQLAGLILAPLDCALAALNSVSRLQNEALGLLGALGGLFDGGVEFQGDSDKLFKDVEWLPGGDESLVPDLGELGVTTRAADDPVNPSGYANLEKAVTIPVGFNFNASTTLEDAIIDPAFVGAPAIDKMIVSVQDARKYIQDLVDSISDSLNSLKALVSGGLGIQLRNLGILMFLADMIVVVMTIFRLVKKGLNVTDWCDYLQKNPNVLEDVLADLQPGTTVTRQRSTETGEEDRLVIRRGPQLVGEISTCSNKRSARDSVMLDQWIAELEGKLK